MTRARSELSIADQRKGFSKLLTLSVGSLQLGNPISQVRNFYTMLTQIIALFFFIDWRQGRIYGKFACGNFVNAKINKWVWTFWQVNPIPRNLTKIFSGKTKARSIRATHTAKWGERRRRKRESDVRKPFVITKQLSFHTAKEKRNFCYFPTSPRNSRLVCVHDTLFPVH